MAAIYQQARPQTFAQLVGQEHVKDVLVAALRQERVGHAYLFSGPRGVGKTTSARLLAMAVNCEVEDPAARPCGVCESCRLVREGRHPDVTELDAASNNSVDDVRELRELVRLAPLRGRQRVWVLDEAHMLSRAASNALLKTLEEPPAKLVFILATTEPEKLPPTILSRTQHFRFRRLSEPEIRGKLARLCQEHEAAADEDALALVARAADGAMRDAESLLERLLTSGERIGREAAEAALGLPPQERLRELAERLVAGELGAVFDLASRLYHDGFAPSSLLSRLLETLRDALVAQVAGEAGGLGAPEDDLMRLIHALDDESERFSRRDDLFSLEVALIKGHNALSGNLPRPIETSPGEAPRSSVPAFDPHARPQPAPPRPQAATPAEPKSAATGGAEAPISWHKVKGAASTQLKAFLNPAEDDIQGRVIRLVYGDRYKFHFGQLKERAEELCGVIAKLYGGGFELIVEGPGEVLRKKA